MADAALREEALQIECTILDEVTSLLSRSHPDIDKHKIGISVPPTACTERGGFVRALYAGRFDRGFPAKHYFLAKDMRLTSRDKIDTLVHRITGWVAKRYG